MQGLFDLSAALCLFRLCYVQSLTGHKSPVTAVSASETTGDIATVCDSGEDRNMVLFFFFCRQCDL